MPDPAGAVPALARSTVDRAAHRRTDPDWLAKAWTRARVVVVADGSALVTGDPPALVLLDAAASPAGDRLFLGVDAADVPYFAVCAPLPEVPGARSAGVRSVGHALSDTDAGLMTTATALANWHLGAGYSPVTGASTTPWDAGWLRRPDDGGPPVWPRTDPVVIGIVTDGRTGEDGHCLLGRKPEWPVDRFSCLAGFVEPGESAEAALAREVAEEAGVHVRSVTYVASQPWPYPSQIMLAFAALADPAEPVVVDTTELAEAHWFSRAAVRDPASRPFLPPPSSIAHHLITRWLDTPD